MRCTVGFLEVRGQERTGAVLQLARALGGDDDEPVRALLRIVRNGAMSVVSRALSAMLPFLY